MKYEKKTFKYGVDDTNQKIKKALFKISIKGKKK